MAILQQIKKFLHLQGLFKKHVRLKIIRKSYNNEVYSYNDFIIKVSRKAHNLALEFKILKKLHGKLIVPQAIIYESFEDIFILIMEKLQGETLEKIWPKISFQEKNNLVDEIIKNLKIFHQLKNLETPRPYDEILKEEVEKNWPKIVKNPHIDIKKTTNLQKDFLHFVQDFKKCQMSLVHHDFWYNNILVYKKKLSGIIDFETAIFAPKQVELFKILHHRFSAQNYLDQGATDYTELEFINLLLQEIKKIYQDLFACASAEQFYAYNLAFYFKLLSRFEEDWYRHENIEKFRLQYCNLEQCKKILSFE